MAVKTILACPDAQSFVQLRQTANWGQITENAAERALKNSLFGISLYDDQALIAMARCIGDGVFNVYIQDVVVKPSWRGKGLGHKMVQTLIKHIKPRLPPDCTLGLMAAIGQDEFYTRLGFTARPNEHFGAGLTAQMKDLSV
jgi:predicted GNAT family N-acyltransferase